MRKIITLAALALGLSGGVAAADHRRPYVEREHGWSAGWSGGVRVTPSYGARSYDRGYQRPYYRNNVTVVRRPVYAVNGRFSFGNGYYRPVYRPTLNVHYRNYYQRPALIVENYDTVPGYVWSPGTWEWNGYEWNWVPGHYDVDDGLEHTHTVINQDSYDNDNDDYNSSTYDNSGYDNSGYNNTYDTSGYYNTTPGY